LTIQKISRKIWQFFEPTNFRAKSLFKEKILSRVINPDSAGKQRNQFIRRVALTVRELLRQPEPNDQTRDMAIFIVLSLDAVAETIEPTVAPWEKRDYWIKADRFRMEWAWAKQAADKMREALFVEDWGNVAMSAVQIAQKLGSIQISPNHRMGKPWEGAWFRFKDGGNS
jgi:hypothetical protein